MNFYGPRFNLILLLTAALSLATGCEMLKFGDKETAALRIHIESNADAADTTQTISMIRSEPVSVSIAKEPILTEADLSSASVIETTGGFAVALKFDDTGTLELEEYSSANPGKHFAIFGQWGEKLANGRWLAAPLISKRNASGSLVFTPDASRDEADQWVKGLSAVIEKLSGKKMKQ